MKYISIDIETTGLNSENNTILSIGAIIEDTTNKLPFEEVPKFNVAILQHQITGSPRAITMNKEVIQLIGEYLEGDMELRNLYNQNSGYKFVDEVDVAKEFFDFL